MTGDHDSNPTSSPVVIDPLAHPGWDALLASHDDASVFHSAAWARVLRETYGHQPVYLGCWEEGRLTALLPLMEVRSRWTGRRGVSLPFTDVCCALGGAERSAALYAAAQEQGRRRGWRYLECRGLDPAPGGASSAVSFYGHVVELRTEAVEPQFASSVRRGIRKAKAAGLRVEFGASLEAMRTFYRLHCLTRQRHGVPPQPVRFFDHLARYVLEPGGGFVATAWQERQAVAAAVFLVRGREAIYKYGASDYRYQHLRPNNLVMGEAMQRCARQGCTRVHLGRTSVGNEGLRRFKLGFGAREERIDYAKYEFATATFVRAADRSRSGLNGLFRCLPVPMLRWAGELLYPHLS